MMRTSFQSPKSYLEDPDGGEDARQRKSFSFGKIFSSFDLLQVLPVFILLFTGILFIYGTGEQVGGDATRFWTRQLTYMALGLVVWCVLTFIDYRKIGPLAVVLYPAAVILLIYVLNFGPVRNHARRWIEIGGTSFQPSEFAKMAYVVALSWMLSRKGVDVNKPLWMFIAAVLTGIPFILIYLEPDLGTALVLVPVAAAIVFTAGLKWKWIIIFLIAVSALMPTVYVNLKNYQKERILTFLDPERDPRNKGWNAIQAEIAVGSGGVAGKGFMKGKHCLLGYLPQTVANSDFIFPVIAEETGFMGTISLLILYSLLFFSILRTAMTAPDDYGRLLCVGIAALIMTHTSVNIGMCIRVFPVTGLPLPLVSCGGTFLVAMLAYLGIVQSVYAHRND